MTNPEELKLWFLKSRICLELVSKLSPGELGQADMFIAEEGERQFAVCKTGSIYQVMIEEATYETYASLKRMMLDHLQPTSIQLLTSLVGCLYRCFYPSPDNMLQEEDDQAASATVCFPLHLTKSPRALPTPDLSTNPPPSNLCLQAAAACHNASPKPVVAGAGCAPPGTKYVTQVSTPVTPLSSPGCTF